MQSETSGKVGEKIKMGVRNIQIEESKAMEVSNFTDLMLTQDLCTAIDFQKPKQHLRKFEKKKPLKGKLYKPNNDFDFNKKPRHNSKHHSFV